MAASNLLTPCIPVAGLDVDAGRDKAAFPVFGESEVDGGGSVATGLAFS